MKARSVLAGLVLFGLATWAALSLATGLLGDAGEASAGILDAGLGPTGSWVFVMVSVGGAAALLLGRPYGWFRGVGDTALVCAAAAVAASAGADGGAVGGFLADSASAALGGAGALLAFLGIAALVLGERLSLVRMIRARFFGSAKKSLAHRTRAPQLVSVADAGADAGVEDEEDRDGDEDEDEDDVDDFEGVTVDPPALIPTAGSKSRRSVVARFELPSPALLAPVKAEVPPSAEELHEEGNVLVEALASYDVQCKLEGSAVGPTVVTYEGKVAAGTKLSKVMGLAGDLSLAFGRKVRVVAGSRPGLLGFEVEKARRSPVSFRELCEDERFQKSRAALPVVLGRGVRGEAVFADLAEMPHAIVAGATGSGKSVCLSAMLCSLLMRKGPDELRLLLVDPKVVELQPYGRIPHMLSPVVTDMGKAMAALRWAVGEMERRYQALASAGCKNLASYNGKVRLGDRLPYIVIVVDEFADLVATEGKAVEALVSRLAQKSRAAGMHLVLATQRPSVDVVTGTIKANFPTRIALRVAQKVDSRTILDDQGAEHLLGRGDMLVKLGGPDAAQRVQCPMVSEEDVEAITGALAAQGMPSFDESVLAEEESEESNDVRPRARKEAKVWS